MTTIYFIRHGQASFGAESYDQLSAQGETQAQILGQYFQKILNQAPLVISGSLQRHQQTAHISLKECFPDVDIITDPSWNEFHHEQVFALYEPRFKQPELLKQDISHEENPRAYLAKIFEGAVSRWTNGEHDAEYDESWPAFQARITQGLENLRLHLIETQPRYAVVYTSGGVISTVVGKLLDLSTQKTFALNWAIANASLTCVRFTDNEFQLLSLNEHQFIKVADPKLLTWI